MMDEQISRLEKLQCESESGKSKLRKKTATGSASKFEHMFSTDDEEEPKLATPESLQKPTAQVWVPEITPGVSEEPMHQDDISARVKKSFIQYWIDELTMRYFQYYSPRTTEKKISLDFSVSQLKANMTDEQTETARHIFAGDILSNIYHKLSEGYRAIMIEYVKEMKFSAKRQKLISVYEFICPMIKSQHTSDRSQSCGSGNDGAGGKKDDTESDDSGNGDVEYVGWSVGGGKMILAGKSSTTQGKTKQTLLYGVSCTEVLEEKNKEAAMTEEDIDVLLGGGSVESTEEKESLMTEEDIQVLLDGASVTSTKKKSAK